MNIATLELPAWAAEAQQMAQKVIHYTPIAARALHKFTPVIAKTARGFILHWYESECYWREKLLAVAGITHNPIESAIKAAISELTSTEAQTTYARIRHIAKEAAMDAIVIGLCGAVAIASGIQFAQRIYSQAKAAIVWVDAKLNPVGPEPVILPTVDLALSGVDALIAEDLEYEQEFMAKLGQIEGNAIGLPVSEFVPVELEIYNPPATDVHLEVARMATENLPKASKPRRKRVAVGATK